MDKYDDDDKENEIPIEQIHRVALVVGVVLISYFFFFKILFF